MSGFIIILAAGILLTLACLFGASAVRPEQEQDRQHLKVNAIDAILPQTQCGKCAYPGCRPYAEAIARGEADINRCPPGGDLTIRSIAGLLGRDPIPFRPDTRLEKQQYVALIDETSCIGCVKCINACPVDAIIGTAKMMHTIIKQNCTGCELCVEPCPVDCISVVPVWTRTKEWVWSKPGTVAEI